MDILDNVINRRIMSGSFPTEKLYPASIEDGRKIDFEMRSEGGLKVLRQNPELLYRLFVGFSKKVDEMELLQRPECYIQSINCLINAKCSEDYLDVKGSLQDATNLCPVITPLDKVLWYGAYAYSMQIDLAQEEPLQNLSSMMYAWIQLLSLAQEFEINTGQTIDIELIKPTTRIFDIITGTYEEKRIHGCLRKLTTKERDGLRTLSKEKARLLSEIQEEKKLAEEVASKTEKEWAIFLQVINDLSERESNIINRISDTVSAKDKIKAIQDYYSVIRNIERAHYFLNGKEISLIPIYDAANERMRKASTFASARTSDSDPFRVNPALLLLARNPTTYNYLFMSFHHFRLAPNKETATRFVSLALTCINRNLGGNDQKFYSLREMIKAFHTTVFRFMRENKTAIENLSFEKLQTNVVTVEGLSLEAVEISDMLRKSWSAKLTAYSNSDAYERDLEKVLNGKMPALGIDEIQQQVNDAEAELALYENKSIARRIVVSLNIIYMFCDALRIMLTTKRGNIKIKDRETVEQYRRDLLKLDDDLVHSVYAHLGEQEIGMLEYREKSGVFSFTLSEQEVREEAYRNSLFSDILKGSIERLTTGIESQNADQIMKTNGQIRAEILCFPDCDEKAQYASWLDSISSRICSALIENCKQKKDDYQAVKQTILTSLGLQSGILPASSVDSLTTAEILYARYALDEYASQGFDFSCISALYYQAFEDAYNSLIWRDYATQLNELVINGVKYTDILDANRNKPITDPEAKGYLDDNNPTQRKYYILFKNKTRLQTTIDLRCMYKSFAIIMGGIINPSRLNGFCEYFAKLTGYSGREDMFRDTMFMKKCCDFAMAISQSADNRNNASHGGSFINIMQCSADKKIVLSDLESVRSSSIGLVQQLLYILQRNKNAID